MLWICELLGSLSAVYDQRLGWLCHHLITTQPILQIFHCPSEVAGGLLKSSSSRTRRPLRNEHLSSCTSSRTADMSSTTPKRDMERKDTGQDKTKNSEAKPPAPLHLDRVESQPVRDGPTLANPSRRRGVAYKVEKPSSGRRGAGSSRLAAGPRSPIAQVAKEFQKFAVHPGSRSIPIKSTDTAEAGSAAALFSASAAADKSPLLDSVFQIIEERSHQRKREDLNSLEASFLDGSYTRSELTVCLLELGEMLAHIPDGFLTGRPLATVKWDDVSPKMLRDMSDGTIQDVILQACGVFVGDGDEIAPAEVE